jgi:hypothetical protein
VVTPDAFAAPALSYDIAGEQVRALLRRRHQRLRSMARARKTVKPRRKRKSNENPGVQKPVTRPMIRAGHGARKMQSVARTCTAAACVLCVVVLAVLVRGALTAGPAPAPALPPAVTPASEPSQPAPSTTSLAPAVPVSDPHTADPDTVAKQALTIMFSPQPRIDRSSGDAFERAAAWLSPRMRTAAAARTESGPVTRWDDWRARQVTITAHVQLGCSGCSPDTPTHVQRVATIAQLAIDPAGHNSAENVITAWVTLVRQQDGWRVDTLTF